MDRQQQSRSQQQKHSFGVRRGTRGSSHLSQVSANDPSNLVLSPAIVQSDIVNKQGETSQNQLPVSMSRGLSPVITGSDLMTYVKRNSKNDEFAKASAQKARMNKMRDLNNTGGHKNRNMVQNAQNSMPVQGKSPLIYSQRKSSHNMDLMHMNMSSLEQQPQLTQCDNTTKKSVYASEFEAPQQIIMNPAMLPNQEMGNSSNNTRQRSQPGSQYARFKLQESIKALARPKQVPICGPRLRELSNIVFEQQVAHGFNVSISAKHKQQASMRQEQLQTTNENFSGPFYMSQNFRPHKVGEAPQESRPYHMPVDIAPKTIRPQSHFSRECQQQMSCVDIIREQHVMASQSSRLIFRPQSGRSSNGPHMPSRRSSQNDTQQRVNTMPQTLTTQTLGITSDGNGRASLQPISEMVAQRMGNAKITDYADPPQHISHDALHGSHGAIKVQSGGSRTLDVNKRRVSRIKSGNVSIKQLLQNPTTSGSMHYRTNMKCQTAKHGDMAQKQLQSQTMTIQLRVNSAKAQPTEFKGDELKIRPNKIYEGSEAVSRQTRVEAYETEKLHAAYAQKYKVQNEKDPVKQIEIRPHDIQENLQRIETANKTVLSRNVYASRASTSRVETPAVDPSKHVTVFDKIVMPTSDMSEGMRSGIITPEKLDITNTNRMIIESNGVVNSQHLLGPQIGSYRRNNMDSTELYLSSNDGIADAKDYLNPTNNAKDNIAGQNQNEMKQEPYSNIAHQQSQQIILGKNIDKVEVIRPTQLQHLQGLQDFQSISSGGRRASAGHLTTFKCASSHSPVSRQELARIAPNASFSNPNLLTKSRLNRIRQEERRCKVRQSIQKLASGDHQCMRCTGQEIEATKKQIDKGYMSSGRSKVYFKPSVVEIHDQSEALIRSCSPSATQLDGKTRAEKQQCYVLGPNSSQENWLGAIKEESQAAMLHASQDSNVMQALLQACEDGPPNLNEIADNPETREFILYLQQVQPDLLISQKHYSSRSVLERRQTLQSGISGDEMHLQTPLLPQNSENKEFQSTLKFVNKKSSKDGLKSRTASLSPKAQVVGKPSSDHLVEVMTAYRGCGGIPLSQVIVEETVGENCMRSSLGNGDVIDTERNKINSTHIINSQETLPAQSPASPREFDTAAPIAEITQPHMLMKDQQQQEEEKIQSVTLHTELEGQTLRMSPSKILSQTDVLIPRPIEQIDIKEDVKILPHHREPPMDYKFDEEPPVNYDGQIEMMQDIFRQISNQRANATRTTVKGQKVIFQPTCREFRRLDFKPVTVDTRRYPPGPDSIVPQPRPNQPHVKGRLSRNKMGRQARTTKEQARTSIEDPITTLKLGNNQVGTRGQFASLLNRKRAEKMVTWDTQPPRITQQSSYSQSGQTTGRSGHFTYDQNQQLPYSNEDIQYFQQQQQQQQAQYEGMVDLQYTNDQDSKPHMSAIREVSSVSHHNDTARSASGRVNANSYRELEPEVREIMHGMMNQKSKDSRKPIDESLHVLSEQYSQQQPTQGQAINQTMSYNGATSPVNLDNSLHASQPTHVVQTTQPGSTQMTHITGWTNRTTPHRRGKPVGADTLSNVRGQDEGESANSSGAQKNDGGSEDTFGELFYDKDQAAAFKAGKQGANRTTCEQMETVEWSDDGDQKKRDDNGHILTHKGNVIRRGFNVNLQSKPRVVSTNDPGLLHHAILQKKFDENKHRMSNYISEIGPPKKKKLLNKQQWSRIQRAQFSYDNLEEKQKAKRTKPRSATYSKHHHQRKNGKSSHPAVDPGTAGGPQAEQNKAIKLPSSSQLKSDQLNGEQVIDGNLFRFDNPDRYKTDQLREQALALLVPGYLQYVYDIN